MQLFRVYWAREFRYEAYGLIDLGFANVMLLIVTCVELMEYQRYIEIEERRFCEDLLQ